MPTLLDRIWDTHVVASLPGGYDLLHVDRHLVHDLGGPFAFASLERRELPVRSPSLTFATPDHCVSSAPGRTDSSTRPGAQLIPQLRRSCSEAGVTLFDIESPDQGIVHVIAPELGLTLPGSTVLCGDSHTCTNGALGALAWGIGTSEVVLVLATQCIVERRPAQCRVELTGTLAAPVSAKDVILALIARHGTDAASGFAVEYTGSAARAMSMEERMTVCNLSIELGAKMGLIAPDETAVEYLRGRRYAPEGADWEAAVAAWQELRSDDDASWDRVLELDVDGLAPHVSWGTTPAHTIPVDATIPDRVDAADAVEADAWDRALAYTGLEHGAPIAGTPLDRVFIGSCANARLSDLVAAADIVTAGGGRVAPSVTAWVVPGSQHVKRAAEALGLDDVFRSAGFEWREPGCSMCLATNEEYVGPGERCLSTSNRNFVGRQGPGSRTHLASPATAAASALAGAITDPRTV
ncbi:MAG: 3-isopropylmalate dehydratase large subunit [Acidimicrobiales bacterium]|nr:3-isopropylmalate dehydratase large subunit [Acidimicrobiales bacterium]